MAGCHLSRARVERAITLPRPSVTVGGATLGGSGKSPLAIACAAEVARAGAEVTLVGHAYRASPRRPRFVAPDDLVEDVGDEAVMAARVLAEGSGARVVVAPRRAAAIAFAGSSADVLVIDGVSQTRPERASLALLAVDGSDPWGDAHPAGAFERLRRGAWPQAARATLLDACDVVVPLIDAPDFEATGDPWMYPSVRDAVSEAVVARLGLVARGRPVWPALAVSRGVWVGQFLLTWERLRQRPFGLITALARPDRILRALSRRGVVPRVVVSARDHGPLGLWDRRRANAITRAREVDLWVATAKCALHAARALSPGTTLAWIDHMVVLPPELHARLATLAPRRRTLTG